MFDDGEYWFQPKRHGYGATPTHWKGWLITALFAIGMAVISIVWLLSLGETVRLAGLLAWMAFVLAAVWVFCRFAKEKTDGDWGWRWNGKLYREIYDDKNGSKN